MSMCKNWWQRKNMLEEAGWVLDGNEDGYRLNYQNGKSWYVGTQSLMNLSNDEFIDFIGQYQLSGVSTPMPCTIYMDKPLSEFGRKMAEEDYETAEAMGQYLADPNEENRMMLAMKLTDKITSAVSTLQRIGCDIDERARIQRIINEQNKECGRFRGVK